VKVQYFYDHVYQILETETIVLIGQSERGGIRSVGCSPGQGVVHPSTTIQNSLGIESGLDHKVQICDTRITKLTQTFQSWREYIGEMRVQSCFGISQSLKGLEVIVSLFEIARVEPAQSL
jgi:hypothetical protein